VRRDIDLRHDLHGRTADFISDTDRRWFAEHPGERSYQRDPLEHELCDPRQAPACVPVVSPPELPDGCHAVPRMEVTQLAPGIRARKLWWVFVVADVAEANP
jgi:hypothetical protein